MSAMGYIGSSSRLRIPAIAALVFCGIVIRNACFDETTIARCATWFAPTVLLTVEAVVPEAMFATADVETAAIVPAETAAAIRAFVPAVISFLGIAKVASVTLVIAMVTEPPDEFVSVLRVASIN